MPRSLIVVVTLLLSACHADPLDINLDGGHAIVDAATRLYDLAGSDLAGVDLSVVPDLALAPPDVPKCGSRPSASSAGSYNGVVCSDPGATACVDIGGAHVCPCDGAPSSTCAISAIHQDGHVFIAQCDPATGTCVCNLDGALCTCGKAHTPEPLCSYDSALNCCF